jgi:2-phospho-L-lactate guanylyltransferase
VLRLRQANSFVYRPCGVERVARSTVMSAKAGWTLVVPVKKTAIAKSRLRDLSAPVRKRLALAFAQDTVTAAVSCPEVHRVVVVTNDSSARRLSELGAEVVADLPDAGLNPALEHASDLVRRHDPAAAVAALSADLPALRAEDLSAALSTAVAPRWFVADKEGDGTTMLGAADSSLLAPSFGAGSAAAHYASGAVELKSGRFERLRLDVDTTKDLRLAVELGVGPHTTEVLTETGTGLRS